MLLCVKAAAAGLALVPTWCAPSPAAAVRRPSGAPTALTPARRPPKTIDTAIEGQHLQFRTLSTALTLIRQHNGAIRPQNGNCCAEFARHHTICHKCCNFTFGHSLYATGLRSSLGAQAARLFEAQQRRRCARLLTKHAHGAAHVCCACRAVSRAEQHLG